MSNDLMFFLVALIILTLFINVKPHAGLLLLLATMYLESLEFSFETPIGRLRPNVLVVASISLSVILDFLSKRRKYHISRPGLYLAAYIGVNFIALLNSRNLVMSNRILLLLMGWLFVCVFFYKHCSLESTAFRMVRLFLLFGLLQALIGTWQMVGEFVRPCGTMGSGDADYFGLTIMGNLLIFSTLRVLGVRVFGKTLDPTFSILLIVNLFLSFVRSAWLGYLAGLIFVALFVTFGRLGRFSVRQKNLIVVGSLAAIVIFASFSLSPNLQEYFWKRISLSDRSSSSISENIRFTMMRESWRNALSSPIIAAIGNGPASFHSQGTELNIVFNRGVAFDPSIATTLMNDTGILGTGMFLCFLWAFYSDVFRTFRANPNSIMAKYAIAFSVGVFGLLISYIATSGLWLPFSWVFFGFTSALAAAARKEKTL